VRERERETLSALHCKHIRELVKWTMYTLFGTHPQDHQQATSAIVDSRTSAAQPVQFLDRNAPCMEASVEDSSVPGTSLIEPSVCTSVTSPYAPYMDTKTARPALTSVKLCSDRFYRVNCVITTRMVNAEGEMFDAPDGPCMNAFANKMASKRFEELFSANTNAMECPPCTVELFRSGCVLILGTKGKPASLLAGILYTRATAKMMNRTLTWTPFVAHNEVTCYHLERKLDVVALVKKYPLISTYQPEVYPALYIRVEGEPVFTIYCGSGQVIITGARTKSDAVAAMGRLQLMLDPFMYD
jgi:TATA-box binding protein (TBP) (component of TFIID and TFIIIB)